MNPNAIALPIGSRFKGRYEIVRCLKAGGMGAVYEVVDDKTRRRRALKVMLPSSVQDADLRARFRLEATITADVESAHIVETFDADIDPDTGSPFIVMELLKGGDLAALVETRGPLPAHEVVLLLGQVALALDKTHAAGIVHRDLKPENLFLTHGDDGSPRVKVLDFGIAKVMAQSSGGARTTRVMGTPLYMSREQIMGEGTVGGAADLYALGHIAYTLLAGEPYWQFEAETSTAQYVFLSKVMAGAPELATARAARRRVALPPTFDAWFAKATSLDARQRFDRASTMIGALAQVFGVAPPRFSSIPAPVIAAAPTRLSAGAAVKTETMSAGPSTTAAISSDRSAQARPSRSLLYGGLTFAALASAGALAGGTHLFWNRGVDAAPSTSVDAQRAASARIEPAAAAAAVMVTAETPTATTASSVSGPAAVPAASSVSNPTAAPVKSAATPRTEARPALPTRPSATPTPSPRASAALPTTTTNDDPTLLRQR